MVFGSNTSSHASSSSDLAGGNLKLEIIDMGDPNDKPTIQCIVKGKTCTIVDTSGLPRKYHCKSFGPFDQLPYLLFRAFPPFNSLS
jgi:hypothetical protein